MKPIHLLATGVLLSGLAAVPFISAQKPTSPRLAEQHNLKERPDAVESQLKEPQVKADCAVVEKDCIERIQRAYESHYKVPSTPTALDHAKTLFEIAAYGAALTFFLYKAIAGYLITQMALTIACKRSHAAGGNDHLAVVATLKKGKTGTLRLHDAQARLTLPPPRGRLLPIELIGVERLTFVSDTRKWPGTTRHKIEWRLADSKPFLNLAPGDQAQFSCKAEVPSDAAVEVEVVVLGQRLGSKYRSQWRSSTISLPVQP